MNIEIIACVSKNYGLGKDEDLLFKIKDDLKWFKDRTKGQICIYGSKTFESIMKMNGKPLPNRVNVVLTRSKDYKAPHGVFVFHSVEDIIKASKTMGEKDKNIMICGGSKVYEEFLPYANTVYLTHVSKVVEDANVFYPIEAQEELGFRVVRKSHKHYDEKEDVYYRFVEYTNPLKMREGKLL